MPAETTVDEIRNVVLLFSNPVWAGSNTIPSTIIRNITALSSQIAYSALIQEDITVLSTRYAQTDNGIIQGLLYVPEVASSSPCSSRVGQYVPSQVVTRDLLPPTNYNLIAIAPWIDAECTKAFLGSARTDPIRAFIFYHPDNGTDAPPGVDDDSWDLGDNGAWQTNTRFPIYALPGVLGAEMMGQLSQYSGNISEVPYGDNITALYDPDPEDYVRIWTEIHVSTPTGLPKIWVFILAIIGLLIVVVATSSMGMHYIYRRRRLSLERRVRSGEVNLEAMGIKRMTVPLAYLEKFPLFTYNYEPDPASVPASPTTPRSPRRASRTQRSDDPAQTLVSTSFSAPAPTLSEKALSSPVAVSAITANTSATTSATDYQPTCQICLQNFQKRVTIIRELPCGHIFHPDCIDEFLGEISSLCPICKTSMLPSGYCPKITNAMVKREQAIAKVRARVVIDDSDVESTQGTQGRLAGWGATAKKKLFRPSANRGSSPVIQNPPARVAQSPTQDTRRRMRELAGTDSNDEQGSWDGRPRWKRYITAVFPGI